MKNWLIHLLGGLTRDEILRIVLDNISDMRQEIEVKDATIKELSDIIAKYQEKKPTRRKKVE